MRVAISSLGDAHVPDFRQSHAMRFSSKTYGNRLPDFIAVSGGMVTQLSGPGHKSGDVS
jgi:hypothetical protein